MGALVAPHVPVRGCPGGTPYVRDTPCDGREGDLSVRDRAVLLQLPEYLRGGHPRVVLHEIGELFQQVGVDLPALPGIPAVPRHQGFKSLLFIGRIPPLESVRMEMVDLPVRSGDTFFRDLSVIVIITAVRITEPGYDRGDGGIAQERNVLFLYVIHIFSTSLWAHYRGHDRRMQAGLCGCLKKAVHGAVHLHELQRKSAEASHDEIGDAAGEEGLGQEALLPMPAVLAYDVLHVVLIDGRASVQQPGHDSVPQMTLNDLRLVTE